MQKLMNICALVVLLLSSVSYAKDMTNRLGIGYKNQFSEEIPSIATTYWMSKQMGFNAAIGVDTQNNNSRFGLKARMYRIIFPEDNMNFYMGIGAGTINIQQPGNDRNGFEFDGFVGCEFYLPGLENLALMFETGINVASLSSGVKFKTTADHPLRAGMTFYF